MTEYVGQPNTAYLGNKNNFFTKFKQKEYLTKEDNDKRETSVSVNEQVVTMVQNLANEQDYHFLLTNLHSIEAEFSQMFAVLSKQRDKNNEVFWLYCYYNASLLESFYTTYSKYDEEARYKKLKLNIRNHLLKVQKDEKEENFIKHLEKSFIEGFRNLITAPRHISKIREYVGFTNLCRMYWIFCRLTLTNGLVLAKELEVIDQLDRVLGTHTDIDQIVSIIQLPNNVLNYASIGIFLIRYVIDAGMLINHTFFKRVAGTTCWERFKHEIYKRQFNFGNDITWAVVNFLTNFNHISKIPGPVAAAVTAVFLGFDMSMFFYKMYFLRKEYVAKRRQYSFEIEEYNDPEKYTHLSDEQRKQHVDMLVKQREELDIVYQKKQATLYFCAGAAALLMAGFSAAIIFTPAGVVVASFFACTIAAAMYFSADQYAKYKETSLRLDLALSPNDYAIARKEYETARNDFIFAMAKHTLVPTFLIATFAVCWPAAIAFTALYLSYELYHSFTQHSANKEIKQMALEAPDEDFERRSFCGC
jgi:hypothetical protein